MEHRRPFDRGEQAKQGIARQPRIGVWSGSRRLCRSQCTTLRECGTFHHYLISHLGSTRWRFGSGMGGVARTIRRTTWNSARPPLTSPARHPGALYAGTFVGVLPPEPWTRSPLRYCYGDRYRPVGFGVAVSCVGRRRRGSFWPRGTPPSPPHSSVSRLPGALFAGTSFGVLPPEPCRRVRRGSIMCRT